MAYSIVLELNIITEEGMSQKHGRGICSGCACRHKVILLTRAGDAAHDLANPKNYAVVDHEHPAKGGKCDGALEPPKTLE